MSKYIREDLTKDQKEELAGIVDSEGAEYALFDGGYITLEDIIEPEYLDVVNDAHIIIGDLFDELNEIAEERYGDD